MLLARHFIVAQHSLMDFWFTGLEQVNVGARGGYIEKK